jgi:two-component system response regulator FlrC
VAKILVVDDEHPIRTLVTAILTGAGHEVSTAANGEEALARLAETSVDLLITDIYMPVMDGIELLTQCCERYPHLPALALSGGGSYGDFSALPALQAALASGAYDRIYKPFQPQELLAAVERGLRQRG